MSNLALSPKKSTNNGNSIIDLVPNNIMAGLSDAEIIKGSGQHKNIGTAPTINLISNDGSLKIGDVATLTFILSRASSNFTAQDVSISGGGLLTNFVGSGSRYSAHFTPALHSTATATVSVARGVFTDAAGNGNTAATPLKMAVDTIAPTISVTANDNALKLGDVATLTFRLSEASSNFTAGDIRYTGGTLSNFVGNGNKYTASFTATSNSTAPATVSVAGGMFSDAAGNGNVAATPLKMTVDTVAPTVSVTSNDNALKIGDIATLAFRLSETPSSFSAHDVSASGGKLTNFSGSGVSYTASFTPTANSTTAAVISVAAGGFVDTAGNKNTATTPLKIPVDTQAPTINVTSNDSALKVGDIATLTFTLSEASSNFSVGDVTVAGGVLSNFAGSGAGYTAGFTPTANSTTPATVSVAAGVFTDNAGNNGVAAIPLKMAVDTVAPTVAIATDDSALNIGDVATLIFTLSEASNNFTFGDINVTGGALTNFSGSGIRYVARFTPTPNSTTPATVNVNSSVFTDAAGNNNAAATPLSMTVDTVPVVSIDDATVTEGNSGSTNATLTVNLSAAVSQTVAVNFLTIDGTAVTGSDYVGSGGVLTFAAGETHKTLTIPVSGDTSFEHNENFRVVLLSPSNAKLGVGDAAVTIVNDDNPPNVLALSALNGSNGFRLQGVSDDGSGRSVSGAGDVNGDGFADLIVGAPGADPHGSDSGSSYVVFGKAAGFASNMDLSSLDGSNGFRLSGVARYDGSGSSVSSAGDVNGDGFADLIVGAPNAASNGNDVGSSYVVFGQPTGFSANVNLSELNGSNGFRLNGVAWYDGAGRSVGSAGDVNGDGFSDLIIGAPDAAPSGSDSGAGYVVFGKATGFAASMNFSSLNGSNGFRLEGATAGEHAGCSVSSAGDVNGDGFTDLIVGAYGADSNGARAGSSYVVFGQAAGFSANIPLSDLNGLNGFRLDGVAWHDEAGISVSSAGDVNNDGFADLIVGAADASAGGNRTGASYVVFGKATGFASGMNLSSLDGNNGFRLDGVTGNDNAGISVDGAGDVNGDGFVDLIVGTYGIDTYGNGVGSSYVVFGRASGFASSVSLSGLNGFDGFRLSGATQNDGAGFSVSGAGDVNGDGFADLLVGAYSADANGHNAGSSYVVFGSDSTMVATFLGSNGADNLRGTPLAESFVSAQGNDSLTGGGGADVFYGGQGSDSISVADSHFQKVDGGGGNDTLALAGAGLSLNLTNLRGRVDGIESVDLTGSGDNLLLTTARDASNLSDSSNTLRVDGNAGDRYSLLDAGWAAGSDVVLQGVNYHSFNNGGVHLQMNAALEAVAALSIANATVTEGNNGNSHATLTVSLSAASSQAVTVDYSSVDDTAVAGVDYMAISGTLTFAAGETRKTLDVPVLGDAAYEIDETLQINLSAPGNAVLADSSATVTITNDDIPLTSAMSLGTLNGNNGFRLSGVAGGDLSGISVSGAGDVNGDGFADLIVGADYVGTYSVGASYVVFGKATGFPTNINLSSLNGNNGFRLGGAADYDYSGRSVSSAGDVNGDGFADLIVGAIYADPNGSKSGAGYVVFGQASGFASNMNLSSLNGNNGFRLNGSASGDIAGFAVDSAGDVNGDGFADLIVGAFRADPNGSDSGSSYVVFGKATGFTSSINLSSLDGSNGFRLDGVAGSDYSGRSVSSAGDVNGDGFADLIVGAFGADPNGSKSGAGYVVFGKASGFAASVNLSSLDGGNGFRLDGVAAGDQAGWQVSSVGDVNGDGFADLIIGADRAGAYPAYYAGASYVVFGRSSGFAANMNLSSLNGSNGFRLNGVASYDYSGISVSGAGDVNGDGFADLIVGAYAANSNGRDAGSSYVVFGKPSGFAASMNLSSLNGANGFRLDGAAADDKSGFSVSGAGDINGDGFADLMVGAHNADPNGGSSGASYMVFGNRYANAVTFLGGSSADNLTGTALAESFVSGQGNDSLIGGGGADVFYGGQGDDSISVADTNFQKVDGGNGNDTLALAGTGLSLNLAGLRGRIDGIETIDLMGSGDNSLVINALDVRNLSGSSNTLRVEGNAGDSYRLSDSGWTVGNDVVLLGLNYHAFDNGNAHILLNTALTAM